MLHPPSRRTFLALGIGALTGLAQRAQAEDAPESLKAAAAKRGLQFGSAVDSDPLRTDASYAALIEAQAGEIVASYEMKWGQTERQRGKADYRKGDFLTDWALNRRLRMRGHTALWHKNLPDWVPAALADPALKDEVLQSHVADVVGRYKGRISQWDVVNEAIEPLDERPDSLRKGPFLDAFGPDYIVEAFRAARAADPAAKLFYNDYGFEYDTRYEDQRRETALRIIADLKKENLIDGLGIQSHLKVGNRFNQRRFRRFLGDAASLGIEIVATEFDVDDTRLSNDPARRDAKIADHATMYLETLLDEPSVSGVLSWGLTSRYTYLNTPPMARSDGLPTRGLPFDENLMPTKLHRALIQAFHAAPQRS